jgi:HK97 family phage major capsid protein
MAITPTTVTLPREFSNEIITNARNGSVVMQLARQVAASERGTSVPIVDKTYGAWQSARGAVKENQHDEITLKNMDSFTLEKIICIPNQSLSEASALYGAIVNGLALDLGATFDATIFGNVTAPSGNFDTLASVTDVEVTPENAIANLADAIGNIGKAKGTANAIVASSVLESVFLQITSSTTPYVTNGETASFLGRKVAPSGDVYKAGNPEQLGFMGDWNAALYFISNAIRVRQSQDATVGGVSMFETNQTAFICEIDCGFGVSDLTKFAKLVGKTA